jgi:hypothetical protein
MKPVLLGLCLSLLFMAGTVSASLEDCPTCVYAYDTEGLSDANPYAGCPTCVFAYDSDGLSDANPYAGCPTCIFAYDSDGLSDANPYAGCPTCIFAYGPNGLLPSNPYSGCPTCIYDYDSNGLTITNTHTGCTSCEASSGTTNTLGSSLLSIASSSPATVYTFPDGTPIPEDYLCPVHGIYCPDDPRPLEERPGYVAPAPTILPTHVPFFDPGISAELNSAFGRASSQARSDRLALFPYRGLERSR